MSHRIAHLEWCHEWKRETGEADKNSGNSQAGNFTLINQFIYLELSPETHHGLCPMCCKSKGDYPSLERLIKKR